MPEALRAADQVGIALCDAPHLLLRRRERRAAFAALVICDEMTAPLDVSVQATVIELLLDLHRSHGTAYLFITNDLNLVRQIAHRIVVMQAGRLVDLQTTTALAKGEGAPYTRALIDASPQLDLGDPD